MTGTAGFRVRALALADVPFATRLVNAEGWAFSQDEVARLLDLGGGVVAEEDGAPLGVLTLVTHEKLAWIGNVAVAPEARGRGVGARLVEGALALARDRGVRTVGLFSVLPAITLYERAGFRRGAPVASFVGGARPGAVSPGVRRLAPGEVADAAKLDAAASGDDRSRLLRTLVAAYPETSFAYAPGGNLRGFAVLKASPRGSEIGPLVTRPGDEEALHALYAAALASAPAGSVEVGVHRAHKAAIAALLARGFKEAFPALAMYWGEPGREGDPLAVGAVAGMEKG